MSTIKEAATDFLSCRRIAVTGVSREPKEHGGNIVYKRLKERGYEVFPVNPNTDAVEGDRAYPDLSSIPGGVEAVACPIRWHGSCSFADPRENSHNRASFPRRASAPGQRCSM